VNALLSKDEHIVIWGTDRWERIVGQREADLSRFLAACPPWRSIVPTRRAMVVGGDLAYVADEVEGTWKDGGERHTEHLRVTCLLRPEVGSWRCIHGHFSSPTE
jgi:hypothetical protein